MKKLAKKKKRRNYNHSSDTHHLLWQKRQWGYGDLKAFRLYPYNRLKISVCLHREIHAKISLIPIPSQRSAKNALVHLKMLEKYGGINENDSIEKRLNVLIALFDYVEQPTADALKKQLIIVRKFNERPP